MHGKNGMTKAERVTAALSGGIPDMVPFILNTVMVSVQEALAGRAITEPTYNGMNNAGWVGRPGDKALVEPALTVTPETAALLGLDAIQIQVLPPLFAQTAVRDGVLCISGGLIEDAGALAAVELPDPDDITLLRNVEEMIKRYKGDFALGARIRLCASPSIMSLGIENLSLMYADGDETLFKTVEMYSAWSERMNKNLSELDFDFFWAFDDIAFTTSMLVSPDMFREVFKEPMRKAASAIGKPWIYHSDGNYRAVLEDIVDIGAYGIHPIERSSMDTAWLKKNYGKKLCLVGNVDIETLSKGSPDEVDAEVAGIIALLGPGGRHIISDSNSIPDGCKAQNMLALAQAVEKYRYIY